MQSIYNSSNLQLLRVHLCWRDGRPLEIRHDSLIGTNCSCDQVHLEFGFDVGREKKNSAAGPSVGLKSLEFDLMVETAPHT
ncbi:unnamed protein product [Macrosiphum euphorbiae]|uniref:Uncharacterized protein n=1 Tax=Macrosiphum euphorbiae TaxID=13131 RepID=A0AAV0W455_9HEMI|nr:unnamed protein product [Macrosiphum euphorbiae]CAI6352625.1 unnamed protein product [Macrosiphum euphorbiae]CAI6363583.1 unnamed protein product [Macrosiphum euphorbiae]CAI6372506.1 unnamed protein product [Macrosiphum euphorbiae]